MDNLIFLLVFAAIAGLQWFFKRMQENAQRVQQERQQERRVEAAPQRRATPPPVQMESEEEVRMRKFLEALGLPSEPAAPPPPKEPVFVPPAIPKQALPLPNLPRRARAQHQPRPVPVLFEEEEEEGPKGGVVAQASKDFAAASRIDVSADRDTDTASVLIPVQLAHKAAYALPQLLTPNGLREAMVVREVLGPPLALR